MSDNEEKEQVSDNEEQLLEDEIDIDVIEPKALKPKQSCVELFDELSQMRVSLDTIESEFTEKDKQYDKDKKEYLSNRKKIMKEIEIQQKKCDKTLKHVMNHVHKTHKTGNSGKGGFNKVIPVPKKLCTFLDLDMSTEMSRPQLTKLLNDKFKLLKFRSTEKGCGKTIVINDKASAKILGCELNYVINFKEFQGFIAKFYKEVQVEI